MLRSFGAEQGVIRRMERRQKTKMMMPMARKRKMTTMMTTTTWQTTTTFLRMVRGFNGEYLRTILKFLMKILLSISEVEYEQRDDDDDMNDDRDDGDPDEGSLIRNQISHLIKVNG